MAVGIVSSDEWIQGVEVLMSAVSASSEVFPRPLLHCAINPLHNNGFALVVDTVLVDIVLL